MPTYNEPFYGLRVSSIRAHHAGVQRVARCEWPLQARVRLTPLDYCAFGGETLECKPVRCQVALIHL
jgi:hypothetical protein